MPDSHLVRIGVLGHVGRFNTSDTRKYRRGTRVICRTGRGLEVGEVLTRKNIPRPADYDGTVLRQVTVEDDLLLVRLAQHCEAAFNACLRKLNEHQITATLMDVEHLFDGQSIYFYFLGTVTPEIEALTEDLAETYDAQVQFRRFTESVVAGCGPDCGTESTEGGCGSACSSCAISGACNK